MRFAEETLSPLSPVAPHDCCDVTGGADGVKLVLDGDWEVGGKALPDLAPGLLEVIAGKMHHDPAVA